MRIKMIFGSTSDSVVAEALFTALSTQHEVESAVISAHRNPDHLRSFLLQDPDSYDLCIAGAGLAAHLPGVIASQIVKPVIGIPIANKLAGLDALLSIQQMPAGIPVLAAGIGNIAAVTNFLSTLNEAQPRQLCVLASEEAQALAPWRGELIRLEQLAGEWEIPLKIVAQPEADAFHIVMISNKNDLDLVNFSSSHICVHVPLLSEDTANNPATALTLLQWTGRGGLWLGINNLRNAFLAYIQAINTAQRWDDRLWSIRRR